jgi:hypothetical protein
MSRNSIREKIEEARNEASVSKGSKIETQVRFETVGGGLVIWGPSEAPYGQEGVGFKLSHFSSSGDYVIGKTNATHDQVANRLIPIAKEYEKKLLSAMASFGLKRI